MFKLLLFLHLLAAIFAVGPLVGAATTASRALRRPDADAAMSAARTIKVYSYASVVVVLLGFGLMSTKAPWDSSEPVAGIGDTWILLSIVFWGCSIAVALGGLVPALQGAAGAIREGGSVSTLTAASPRSVGRPGCSTPRSCC